MKPQRLLLKTIAAGGLWALLASWGYADGSLIRTVSTFSGSSPARTLQFDLQPLVRCSFGDFDVLTNDLQQANNQLTLQLSVEQLSGEGKKVFFGEPRREKTADSNVGTYDITIPASDQVGVFGAFLCSVRNEDSKKVPCSQQALLSFEQMAAPYKTDSGGIEGGSPPSKPYQEPAEVTPKLYFAQFFGANAGSLAIFTNTPTESSASQLAPYGVAASQAEALLGRIRPFAETLGSLPFEANDDRLQMVLPYFSEKKCIGK